MENNGDPAVTSTVKFHAIKVKVTPIEPIPTTGHVPCHITLLGSAGGGHVGGDKITLDPEEGPFALQFDLDHRLDWAAEGDLIWLQLGECPTGACPLPSQIWVSQKPNDRVLTIMNMNVGERCTLHYQLNFTNGRYWDPVIENGGGNRF